MIDQNDADFAVLTALGIGGWTGVIIGVIAIILTTLAFTNAVECSKSMCPLGATPILQSHVCQCVLEAKPREIEK